MSRIQLLEAARDGNVNEVRRLVERENVDPYCKLTVGDPGRNGLITGWTPLHFAARENKLAVIKYLIEEAGVGAGIRTDDGQTALHLACDAPWTKLPVVRYLVETAGLDVNEKGRSGASLLHYACINHHMDVTEYVVEKHQARVDVKDNGGWTPLDEALRSDNEDNVRYLLPRVESIDERALRRVWVQHILTDEYYFSWDVKAMMLPKYAIGCGMGKAFEEYPLHTILEVFPLPCEVAFQECIANNPSVILISFGWQGTSSHSWGAHIRKWRSQVSVSTLDS